MKILARTLLLPVLLLALALPLSAGNELLPSRIATIDWAHTETLLALGASPMAVAEPEMYRTWVGQPPLPSDALDIGLRMQPNLEVLASLQPSLILLSPQFAGTRQQLEKIAPVELVELYTARDVTWEALLDTTMQVARLTGLKQQGQQLVADSRKEIADMSAALGNNHKPFLLIQFLDSNHVRVFGPNSLFNAVLEALGLENAWQEQQNWGFSVVGLNRLLDINARLVIVKPLPVGGNRNLMTNRIWRHMVSESGNTPLLLEPVWSFGGLPSAMRFARYLTDAVTADSVATGVAAP